MPSAFVAEQALQQHFLPRCKPLFPFRILSSLRSLLLSIPPEAACGFSLPLGSKRWGEISIHYMPGSLLGGGDSEKDEDSGLVEGTAGNSRVVGETGLRKTFQSSVVSDVMGRCRVCQRRDSGLGFPSSYRSQNKENLQREHELLIFLVFWTL